MKLVELIDVEIQGLVSPELMTYFDMELRWFLIDNLKDVVADRSLLIDLIREEMGETNRRL